MVDSEEYDRIFAALKHPVRRQILLLVEEKGEVAFTEIQKTVGTEDTGLLSYHLKELSPLISQSERGKYVLSEIGRASMALFRKVERERQTTSVAVQREMEKMARKVICLFLIFGATSTVPLSVDVYLFVAALSESLALLQMILIFLVGLLGMMLSELLFVFYYRHYFSKEARKTVIHSTLFAAGVSALSFSSAYASYCFQQLTLASSPDMMSQANINNVWLLSLLRTIAFLAVTPIVTYAVSRFLNRR